MKLGLFRRRGAAPAIIEGRAQVVVDPGLTRLMDAINGGANASVTFNEAMSLPAVFAANTFLASTLAALPIQVFERRPQGEGDKLIDHPIRGVLNDAANDGMTAFDVRQIAHGEQFGQGRGYIYVERQGGEPVNLFPMEYDATHVLRTGAGRVYYSYTRTGASQVQYAAPEVIDLAFRRRADWISSDCPVLKCAAAIRQGLNAENYALTVFGKNGVPPYTLEGPFPDGATAERAAVDVTKAAGKAAANGRPIMPIPVGHQLKRLGDDPEKMQLTAVQVFVVQQVARIYGLPPVFLQDLSTGTFANVEQQDLHLIKHTLGPRVAQIAQELTLKLFGRGSQNYLKFDLDALARGILKDRVEAIARGIASGQFTQNEGREFHGLAPVECGDRTFIQSGTVPIDQMGEPDDGAQTDGGEGDDTE